MNVKNFQAVLAAMLAISLSGRWAGGDASSESKRRAGFTDVTREAGVTALVETQYRNLPKWWFSGLTLVDIDGDGFLDLHLAGHGWPAIAAANDGKGHFTRVDPKADIPRGRRGTRDIPYPGGEIRLVYDLNEDGKPDILASYGDGQGVTSLNDSTPGKPPAWNFKVYDPGFNCFSRGTAMADMNRDGLVDYLVNAGKAQTAIFFGKGDGKWARGVRIDGVAEDAGVPVDLDGDGDLDLLLSQRGYTPVKRAVLLNDGKLHFSDITKAAGLDADAGSIHGAGDLNRDGHPDLICIEGKQVVLYLNDGKAHFTQAPAVEGMEKFRRHIHTGNWGGAVVADLDNDATPDILVNGRYFLLAMRGLGGGRFVVVNKTWGIPAGISPAVDEGLCFGDINGDGRLDLLTKAALPGRRAQGAVVLRNDLPAGHWLRVRPIGRKGNLAAAGAKIRLYEAGGMGDPAKLLGYEQVAIWGRQSFHSYYFPTVTERHFGLGNRQAVDVHVEFYPSGRKVEVKGAKADTTVDVREE